MLLSLNKAGHNFKIEAAAIKVFVNSDGQITEFAFDGSSKTVYAGEENVIIFSKDTEDNKDTHKDENQTRESSSIGIIGGADGPTSIYVAGEPLKAMITPAIVLAIIIFAGGFALGYIFKAPRYK